jgi:hypothetical protein
MIPDEILSALEAELDGLAFGKVVLTILLHDGKPRYVVSREVSLVPGKAKSGSQPGGPV